MAWCCRARRCRQPEADPCRPTRHNNCRLVAPTGFPAIFFGLHWGVNMPTDADKARRYRERAAQVRSIITDVVEQKTKDALETAARDYEEMAARLEAMVRGATR